jgi:hypothetical protein
VRSRSSASSTQAGSPFHVRPHGSNRALWPTPGHGGIHGTLQHVLPSHMPAQEPHPPCQRPSPCEHPRRVSRVIARLLLLLAVAALLLHAPRGRPCHCHRYVVGRLLPVNALILRAPRSACVATLPMGGEGTKHPAGHREAATQRLRWRRHDSGV